MPPSRIYSLDEIESRNNTRFSGDEPISLLSDLKFAETETLFNRNTVSNNQFGGIIVFLWLAGGLFTVDILCNNYNDDFVVIGLLFQNILRLIGVDLCMYLTIYVGFVLQLSIRSNILTWKKSGWIINSVFELLHLVAFYKIYTNEAMGFSWIGQSYLFLHHFVLLMKLHSYSSYNGYLWQVLDELEFSRSYKGSEEIINKSIKFTQSELDSQSLETPFPENINLNNFFQFTVYPTVVYQIEYPKRSAIRWWFVFQKILVILGTLLLMFLVSQVYFYPIVMECIELYTTAPLSTRFKKFPLVMLDMIPIFTILDAITFYLIWDAILNLIAEVTKFASRDFYGDWWNSTSWNHFSRNWNIPVHKYLYRHVYHAIETSFNTSKKTALISTFLISSIAHELAAWTLFGKFRGYLFLLQMSQIPMMNMTKTQFFKNNPLLRNILFWLTLLVGHALISSLYFLF